jgi:hypothetical protein
MLEGNANLKKDRCNQTNPKNENEIQHPPLKPLQKMILKKQYVKKIGQLEPNTNIQFNK